MYARVGKRVMDFGISLAAILLLSPVFLVLTALGAFFMKGNPFFTQARPGRHEKIFRLIKFRTMTNARGADGELLPDAERLNGYGRFLRASSLDELPELFNILAGQMALVGPRPALWNQFDLIAERDRYGANGVRPGLTGWAQINGRDELPIPEKARRDGYYANHISFGLDVKLIVRTFFSVIRFEGVVEGSKEDRK